MAIRRDASFEFASQRGEVAVDRGAVDGLEWYFGEAIII